MKTGVKYVLGNGLRGSFKITKAIERDLVSKTNTAQANTNVKKQSGLPIIIISGKIDYVTESRTWVNVGQYIHNESNNPTDPEREQLPSIWMEFLSKNCLFIKAKLHAGPSPLMWNRMRLEDQGY